MPKGQKKGPYDVTFDELFNRFQERAKMFDLFTDKWYVQPKDAFKIYLDCWGAHLARTGEITRQTFHNWKKRGWVSEERAKDFMVYTFGNRWTMIKPNAVL